jgi:hypothetical protein
VGVTVVVLWGEDVSVDIRVEELRGKELEETYYVAGVTVVMK